MNVLYVTNNLNSGGGIEKVLSLNANSFVKNGINVTIMSLSDEGSFYELSKSIKVFSLSDVKNVFFKLYKLRKFVNENDFDIIIGMSMHKLNTFVGLSTFGLPVKKIASEHIAYNYGNYLSKFLKNINVLFFDCVVLLTDFDKRFYRFKKDKIHVIRNPIEVPSFIKPQRENVVLAAGHLIQRKSFDRLIYIWSNVDIEVRKGWRLKIVGEGPEFDNLKNEIEKLQLNDVELVGGTRDINSYYNNAKIFALTSISEGLPMVLIEALSFGLSLISFDCQTGPREIITNKNCGVLITDNDCVSFSHELSKLMLFTQYVDEFSMNENCLKYAVSNVSHSWFDIFKKVNKGL